MNQPVTLKGVRSGIALQMDPEAEFGELLPLIREKFESSASFFGNAHMVLSLEGREVSEAEVSDILDLIGKHTRLQIVAVLTEDREMEERFSGLINEKFGGADSDGSEKEQEGGEALFEGADTSYAEIHIGTLRSGTSYVTESSLIVLGDVKQGAEVTAAGSIFVLGSMLGIANAGCLGDTDAFVMATHLDPLQIRISDNIAISEDREAIDLNSRGIIEKLRRADVGPEVALLENGHIVIRKYDNNFRQTVRFMSGRKKQALYPGHKPGPEDAEHPEEEAAAPGTEEREAVLTEETEPAAPADQPVSEEPEPEKQDGEDREPRQDPELRQEPEETEPEEAGEETRRDPEEHDGTGEA